MRREIPAPGYTKANGFRAPNKAWGEQVFCQIRGSGATAGLCDPMPWPVETTRWKWERDEEGNVIEHPGDIVAVKAAD